ncbi:PVC-type heme-binding CxxCH protein [Albibacterium bauzanense]|uniref:Putative membrane-bound dehydrogenase-like protein n=1 Tax=Albibacterium bauzanense TaxID=653929 RepID=A0A4R1LQM3_9SPHI|nr:PVC-type heme-binding CxxCH protein [Albibacterium bauzanense]TCK80604.1 putative membrane-bound dehydrogenase-like protein [Albibacterium bauzanense]
MKRNIIFRKFSLLLGALLVLFSITQCTNSNKNVVQLKKGSRIVLIGNNLGSRMMNYGHFETEMHLRYPDSLLFIRNMSDGGNTPGFRPHSARKSPWAFPGAEKFHPELADYADSEGHFPTEDEWLFSLKPDIIIAFFGYNESFDGEEGLANYKAELDAFIKHTLSQKYNGDTTLQLAIVSPIAFEDLSAKIDLPNGKKENVNLELYSNAMEEVAAQNNILFVDAFNPSKRWYNSSKEDLTIDGFQLTDNGYVKFSKLLADEIFGNASLEAEEYKDLVHDAVLEKNWMWHSDFKIPNGVHAYGRRYDPFGADNYPAEVAKLREMTAIRDEAIWKAAKGEKMDLALADQKTSVLPPVKTNYDPKVNGDPNYLYGQEALDKFHVAPGYKVELFASEEEFPDLENPAQMSFDNKGRLWVATMPTYPHWRPGDPKPNDKLIIYEDTDGDGKADKQTVFADKLHLPIGFEVTEEGVYLSQGTNLVILKDVDGDDKADTKEILLSGFDDHDTHHAHSAYTVDPAGGIYMGEGVFLHTNVETPYGPVRATNGGFYRYDPLRHKLDRVAQLPIPNPWGIAFDKWGENFFTETSSPAVRWMRPGSIKLRFGQSNPNSKDLIEPDHRVRPTSGLEFIYSRHFPDEVQGDFLLNNTIGFLGTKQHTLDDDGTGYKSRHRQDLLWSDDRNYRPVDLEFAPDGSLYIIDWHNVLIGHMQHNARDPLRDHVHGRIYRVTYPSRPLVKPAKVDGATIEELLENLKLPEARTRSRSRNELRGRKVSEVLSATKAWVAKLAQNDPNFEHNLLEALWVTWGMNQVDQELLGRLLNAKDYHARSAAVQVLGYNGHQIPNQTELLMKAAQDEHGRVRLEAIVAASWLEKDQGLAIVNEAGKMPLDDWMMPSFQTALASLRGEIMKEEEPVVTTSLEGAERDLYIKGSAIFARDGFCITCHQPDGKGLEASGFPPISGSQWALGNEDRLIKLTLKGLQGPIEVLGKKYPGQVPMTPFGGMLNDEEIASVLTYVRNSFGNKAPAISPAKVKAVRASIENKTGFYSPEELLSLHPLEK